MTIPQRMPSKSAEKNSVKAGEVNAIYCAGGYYGSKTDGLTYLRAYEPNELVRFSGNTYTTRTHDSLKISNGKWMWWSRGIGGNSALDYLVKVKGLSFLEAVETIMGCKVALPTDYCAPKKETPKKLKLPP